MKIKEFNELTQSQPDTQNTGMAQNQLLKIGQHAIKIENMIANNQEISEWASNKINLASGYVKKIHNTLSEFDKPRETPYPEPKTLMSPKELGDRIEKAKAKAFKKPEQMDITKLWTKEKPATEDESEAKVGFGARGSRVYAYLNDQNGKSIRTKGASTAQELADMLMRYGVNGKEYFWFNSSVDNVNQESMAYDAIDIIKKKTSESAVEEDADDTRMEDALIKKFGKDKAKVIMDYAYSQTTDSSE